MSTPLLSKVKLGPIKSFTRGRPGPKQGHYPFLTRNRNKLRYIIKTKEIQHAVLNFGVDQKVDGRDVLMASYLLPDKLLQLAGELGISIELTFYAENMEAVLEKSTRLSQS